MSSVGLMQEAPPFVRFSNEEVEDRDASIEAGYYVSKNVPIATITPSGGRDNVKKTVEELLVLWKKSGQEGRQPLDWYNHLVNAFNAWKEGNEIPDYGTPVLTFLPFTPAQRHQLINANIRTIEECAVMNEDTLSRVGMGGRELKERAIQALSTADKVASENAALKVKLETQEATISQMQAQIAELMAKKGAGRPPKKGAGRPPKEG